MFDSLDCMDRGWADSSVCGILQARILEWGAMSFSREEVYTTRYKISSRGTKTLMQRTDLCTVWEEEGGMN